MRGGRLVRRRDSHLLVSHLHAEYGWLLPSHCSRMPAEAQMIHEGLYQINTLIGISNMKNYTSATYLITHFPFRFPNHPRPRVLIQSPPRKPPTAQSRSPAPCPASANPPPTPPPTLTSPPATSSAKRVRACGPPVDNGPTRLP